MCYHYTPTYTYSQGGTEDCHVRVDSRLLYTPGMVTSMATLSPKVYTPADREFAYQLWRTLSGRSCRDVARRMGATYPDIARETVTRWMHEDGWKARADQEDSEDIQSMRQAIGAVVATQVVPSLETAQRLRDDPNVDPRVRLDAAKWLAGLAGVAPVSKIEQAVTYQQPKDDAIVDAELKGKSADELMKAEQAYRQRKRER